MPYYSEEYLRALAPKIRLREEALREFIALLPTYPAAEGEKIASLLVSDEVPLSMKADFIRGIMQKENGDMIAMLLYLAASGYTHEIYQKRGYSDEIFYDTFNCIPEKIWTNYRLFGRWGCDDTVTLWPLNHCVLGVFRIGRLGYQPDVAYTDVVIDGKTVIQKGEPMIHVHISNDEKLTGCRESLDAARKFFTDYYKGNPPRYFHCGSWLIDPALRPLLSPTSNILDFQSLFTIYEREDRDTEVLFRIFGFRSQNLYDYKPTSSLGERVLDAMREGKHLGVGRGFIPFSI